MTVTYSPQRDNRFIMVMEDIIDMVVNPHYNTFESTYLNREFDRLGIHWSTYESIDYGFFNGNLSQYVVIETTDNETIVKIKLLLDENEGWHYHYGL